MRARRNTLWAGALAATGLIAALAWAQPPAQAPEDGQQQNAGREGGRFGGGFDRAQMRQRLAEGGFRGPFGGPGGPGNQPAVVATDKYLFVVRGNTVYQLDLDSLKLLKQVDLPDPAGQNAEGGGRLGGRLQRPDLEGAGRPEAAKEQ